MAITRKVMRTGYTLMFSLPKYWVEMQNIQKGDNLKVEIQKDGALLLTPERG